MFYMDYILRKGVYLLTEAQCKTKNPYLTVLLNALYDISNYFF